MARVYCLVGKVIKYTVKSELEGVPASICFLYKLILEGSSKYKFAQNCKVEKKQDKGVCRQEPANSEKHRTATPNGTFYVCDNLSLKEL